MKAKLLKRIRKDPKATIRFLPLSKTYEVIEYGLHGSDEYRWAKSYYENFPDALRVVHEYVQSAFNRYWNNLDDRSGKKVYP